MLTQQTGLGIENWRNLPGELTEIRAAERSGHIEPGGYLVRGRVFRQARQPPARAGLQLRRDIMKDLGEVAIDNLPAFVTGNTREPSEPVFPPIAPGLIIGVIRHSAVSTPLR